LAARRLALKRAFRPSLDRLGVTADPATRAAVGKLLGRLTSEPLPGAEDFEALLYPVGIAWVRQVPVPERSLWVVFRFDEHEVAVLVVVDREPVSVEE
jgi:hypothetical protein